MIKISRHIAGAIALVLVASGSTSMAAEKSPIMHKADGAKRDEVPDLKPYPAAKDGQKRTVIQLPALATESDARVELIVGKTSRIDCNQHFFGGQIEEHTAQGWGYSYYVLEGLGAQASTMMGCSPTSARTAFVRSSHETLIRYNSKLPIVIYTPKDVEVRYRVWKADEEQSIK